ncbi:peptide-N4-(N-acetyl-beta- glucosaminyl)asparagine amidase, partial [Podila epigama]
MDKDAQNELARKLAEQFASQRRPVSIPTVPTSISSTTTTTTTTTATTTTNSTNNISAPDTTIIKDLAERLGALLPQVHSPPATTHQKVADSWNDVPDPSIYEKEFVDVFRRVNEAVRQFEDRELLDMASDLMPIGQLFEEAEAMASDYPEDSIDDIVIRRLLHWFKEDFFKWVDQPPCISCQGKTIGVGGAAPTAQERADGAGMVETYRCAQSCHQLTRFPRYGGMSKILLETRRGRCGEWANCFTLCCRALGYKARFVHDTTDHVWTEVWSEHKKRWIHCDACEEAYDQPLLYTTGWGKTISYCIAFS